MRFREIVDEMNTLIRNPGEPGRLTKNSLLNAGPDYQQGWMLAFGPNKGIFPSIEEHNKGILAYEDPQDLKKAIAGIGKPIIFVNPEYAPQARAMAYREMINEAGVSHYFGKYLKSTKKIVKWPYNDATDKDIEAWDVNSFMKVGYFNPEKKFARSIGKTDLVLAAAKALRTNPPNWKIYQQALAGNFVADPSAPKKETTKQSYLPTAVLTNTTNVSAKSVVDQVRQKYSATNPELVAVTESIANGAVSGVVPQGITVDAFRVEYCEILHPLAIISGAIPVGNPLINFSKGLIDYNTGKSDKLSDSSIKLGNKIFLVSSKDGGGTRSSLGGIEPDFDKFESSLTPAEKKYFALELKALKIIFESKIKAYPGNIGPLGVGVLLKIITQQEAESIASWDQTGPKTFKARGIVPTMPKDATPNLVELINSARTGSGLSPYYQALYAVMTRVSQWFNQDPKMNELLTKVLSESGKNLIVISTVTDGKNGFKFVRRNAQIKLDTGESYMPDWAKKKLAFKIT